MSSVRSDAWTSSELQCLYDVVNDTDWFAKAAGKIDRSANAIRARMSALREEAGIIPGVRGPRSTSRWAIVRDDAAHGSSALLKAVNAALPRRRQAELPREQVQLTLLTGPLFDWADGRCADDFNAGART